MQSLAIKRSGIGGLVLFAVLLVFAYASKAATDRNSLSVDDMMQVEGLGSAASDPTGRWLIFERLRPYGESDDFSFRTYAFKKTGHQLWQYDVKRGGAPKLLPALDRKAHSYLQDFSRSGRFLSVMQYRLGALSLSAYDTVHGTAVRFSQTPAFSRGGSHNPVWVSDDELIFSALPKGEESELTSVRAHTGRVLAKAWKDAWNGQVATASEVRTFKTDNSDQQENGSLVRANARTGKSETVAEGLYVDLRVSPDRRYLAALAVSKPRPTDLTKLAEDDPRRYRLTMFDLETGEKRMLAPGLEFFPYTTAWGPDSTRLAVYGWRADDDPRNGRFYVIDVAAGSIMRYDHTGLDLVSERERGWLQRPERTAFLKDRLAVFARQLPAGEDQAPRFTYQDVGPINLSKPDWFALASDGSSMNLTKDLTGVSGVPIHAGSDHLTVMANDGAYRLYADGQHRRLTPQVAGRFQFVPSGTFATNSGVNRPDFDDKAIFNIGGDGAEKIVMMDLRDGHEGENVVVDASANAIPLTGSLAAGTVFFRAEEGAISRLLVAKADSRPKEIARVNVHLAGVNLGTWKVVHYEVEDADGKQPPQTIESCVLLPPGYTHEAPPPMIVEVYPNARPNCKNSGPKIDYPSPDSPYLWAGKGYAYARLTLPRALIRTEDGPISGMPELVDTGVNALVMQGFADPKRLALVGFSQGGVSALYVAAHSKRFKAIIAANSWADLFSHYFGGSGIYSYVYGKSFGDWRYDSVAGSEFGIGRTPFEDPGVYYRNSPVFLAPQIDTPVLLIHSDMDEFSMSQFDEMFGALTRAGKDARYVRYWGEGHEPSSPANIRDLWKRMDEFLFENDVAPKSVAYGEANLNQELGSSDKISQ